MAEATPPTLPAELPVLPLRRTVAFPLTLQPLAVNRPVSIESVNRALGSDRMLFMVLQESDTDDPSPDDLRRVGTVGIIRQMAKTANGIDIIVEGVARARARPITRTGTTMRAEITPLPERVEHSMEVEAHLRRIHDLIEKAVSLSTGLSEELRAVVLNIDDPLRLVYVLATLIDMIPADKQALLEENDILKKLQAIAAALTREVSLLELKGKIESQAQQEMTDAQRQYYLRQQLKAIQQAPGVGKTSLGQSIARAMSRKFVRMSLGGVRDEAEIRGHRRTYIGSMPGRIVQALKQAGAMNPVFMLDEIDKVAAGYQGDPAAALLEVLDPAQNHSFRDHFLEIPIDLSRVLFIATANQLGTVHPALLDRMEIIQLSGYTEEEKVQIARKYLLPRQLAEHGLPEGALELTAGALSTVISEYTREAGVRNLERQLGTIARKVAARIATLPPGEPPP